MTVGLLIIATNKYTKFIQPLIDSADKFFLKDVKHKMLFSKEKDVEVIYHIFTDKTNQIIETDRKVIFYPIEHKPWPLVTLSRYETFYNNRWALLDNNYLFYCDVDMLFVDSIGKEILSKRVATLHPGYVDSVGTPERNLNSTAYIRETENNKYFAGGFNGGESDEFIKMSTKLHFNINKDLNKGIIAVWHDESHLNNYLHKNKPTVILDPGYCYPENSTIKYDKKLIALDKEHSELRGTKCGVILFHKNIKTLYQKRWVDRCLESIINQTHSNYTCYEINYGADDYSLIDDYGLKGKFYSNEMSNHAEAMNFIIDKSFEDGCDVIFNINLDDYYDIHRFTKQLIGIEKGYDVVSSDFVYVHERGNLDIIEEYLVTSDRDIKYELDRGNNVVAHPVVCFNKRFWESNRYIPSEIPKEDLNIWIRGINSGFKFFIIRDILLYYRIHNKQITSNERGN